MVIAISSFLYYSQKMNDTLTIRLGSKLAQALEQEAQETGRAKGEIVRESLELALQGRGKATVMRRYAGMMSGPSDLSTNKVYRRTWNKKRA